jgi:Uma2 family endonuclease
MTQHTPANLKTFPHDGAWTAADLTLMPRDGNLYEVIDGHVAVIYGNEQSHFDAVWSLTQLLSPFVWKSQLDIILGPLPYRFADDCEVQPDIVVLPRARALGPDGKAPFAPLELVVEVATPYTERSDCYTKRALYQRLGVKTYWIVHLEARELIVWTATGAQPEGFTEQVSWQPATLGDALRVDVRVLFESLPEFQYK